jgi:hypothetical protein
MAPSRASFCLARDDAGGVGLTRDKHAAVPFQSRDHYNNFNRLVFESKERSETTRSGPH